MITSNYHSRPILHAFELEDDEFDTLEQYERENSHFIRYKGMLLNVDGFMLTNSDEYWTASYGISNTGAVVLHLNDDCESVVLGIVT